MAKSWQELTKLSQGASLIVREVQIADSGITIRGEFEPPRLAELPSEDQVFILAFLRTQGSIKEMEQLFGVSYPTIKARLARINEQLSLVELDPPESRQRVLEQLERGEISAAVALERLKR